MYMYMYVYTQIVPVVVTSNNKINETPSILKAMQVVIKFNHTSNDILPPEKSNLTNQYT